MADLFKSIRDASGVLPIVGLAATHSWILTPFLSGDLFYLFFHMGFSGLLLAYAAYRHVQPCMMPRRDIMPWAAAVLMCASSLVVFLTGGQVCAIEIACGVVSGVASAYCFARWFWAFCSLTLKTAVDCTLLAFALSGCVRLVLVGMQAVAPVAVITVLVALLPFASVGCLRGFAMVSRVRGSAMAEDVASSVTVRRMRVAVSTWPAYGVLGDKEDNPNGNQAIGRGQSNNTGSMSARAGAITGGAVLALLGELAVYGLAFGFLRNGINEWSIQTPSMMLGHCLRIVLPLLLLWWLQLREGGQQASDALRTAVLLVLAGILAAVFFTGLGPAVSSAIVLAARSLVSILIYMRLFDVAHASGEHPCTVYGVGRGAYELSLVVGLAVYSWVQGFAPAVFWSSGATYFFVSCVLLLMLNSFANAMKLPFLQPVAMGPADMPLDERCDRAACNYSLSDRELEIMRLICKGHTKKRIAELIGLSEDTIRYHTKSLYRKLDVHSRQELLDVLGIE